jgi:phosphoribosylaminoimidazole-succinocarboxamide synthase
VVRGYISGSAWKEYAAAGTLAGEPLEAGLTESQKFPQPIFSPATKAETGHDENITIARMREVIGLEDAFVLESMTRAVYTQGEEIAREAGIIIADTKFEFGVDERGHLVLADEVFTPDSSRYWAVETYQEGVVAPSFDKQFVRNWLLSPESGWDRGGDEPPPQLPPTIVDATRERYINAYERISGLQFADWIGPKA